MDGERGDDTIHADSLDHVDGGSNDDSDMLDDGNRGDVLVFSDSIDLTNAGLNGHFTGIETISLKNAESGASGNQTLTLNVNDVLQMSDGEADPSGHTGSGGNKEYYDEHTALRIDADSGDTVNLTGGGWHLATGAGDIPAGYTLYSHVTSGSNPADHEDAYVLVSTSAAVTTS
jgi:hypothetical protein